MLIVSYPLNGAHVLALTQRRCTTALVQHQRRWINANGAQRLTLSANGSVTVLTAPNAAGQRVVTGVNAAQWR